MAAKSDAELQIIAAQPDRYEPEALLAALQELEKRNLAAPAILQLKENVVSHISQQQAQAWARASQPKENTFVLFKPTKRYFYTPIILYLNVAIWLVMIATGVDAFQPSVQHLISWGGNLRSLTLNGEDWRLLTSMFLHGGIIHLGLNMFTLLQVGALLEIKFGNHRFFVCYLAAGILASVASIGFHDNIVSVGASGAIFGLYGLFLALLVTKNIDIPYEARKSLLSSTGMFIVYNLVFGFAVPGIDNAAHIGGLVSGFVLGLAYYPATRNALLAKIISIAIIFLVALVVVQAPKFISDKYGEFQRAIDEFARNEKKAMWMYEEELPDADLNDIRVYRERLQREGVFLWKENLALLNSLNDMPQHLQKRVDLLKRYSELRIQSCETMAVMVGDSTAGNLERMDSLAVAIDNTIQQLKDLNTEAK